ncbi:MAG: hypothetical protein F6K55_07450 [Moorea sp. SIO4A3]|nr:hypothetical protein [Moorena sp. SIO4A3]
MRTYHLHDPRHSGHATRSPFGHPTRSPFGHPTRSHLFYYEGTDAVIS